MRFHAEDFVGATALAAASAVTRRVYGAASGRTLKAGLIGCGWYGNVDIDSAFKVGGIECAAVCDVDSENLSKSAERIESKQGARPKTYKDYRDLLEHPGLDFLILAPPTQWHALPFIAACEKGLDIYAEKPVAYDIREGRAMLDAHEKAGNIVQVGFQRRQTPSLLEAAEFIKRGGAGRIVQVEAQIHYTAGMRDSTPQSPPPSLDWDLWCGPAPLLPYHPNRGHFAWRLEKTTGHGHLVDWGIHKIDALRVALDLGMPTSVTAVGGQYVFKDEITTPDILTVNFEFGRCPVVWRHRIFGAPEWDGKTSNGIFFYGDKATIFLTNEDWTIVPRKKGGEREQHKPENRDVAQAHMQDFLDAVRTRKQPSCLPLDAFYSTAAVQLAMIAYETNSRVDWDIEKERITGNRKANALLKRKYRGPWKHPYRG